MPDTKNRAMRKVPYSYVRRNRRRWGLSQRELAVLIGLSSSTTVSRIERSERKPSAATLIACGVVFGLAVPDLFPTLHAGIEEAVLAKAKELYERLEEKNDKQSELKRKLLEDILARVIKGRNQKSI